jgi:hypothetical protein
LPGKVGISLLVVPGVLKLPEEQRRIIDPEIHSVPVAQLRIIQPRARLITVEDAAQNCELFRHVEEHASSHGRQRRRTEPAIVGQCGEPGSVIGIATTKDQADLFQLA